MFAASNQTQPGPHPILDHTACRNDNPGDVAVMLDRVSPIAEAINMAHFLHATFKRGISFQYTLPGTERRCSLCTASGTGYP